MNKVGFYREIRGSLKNFSSYEVEKIIEYYDELILEKVENGMSEKEAINSFGDLRNLTNNLKADLVLERSENVKTNSFKNFLIILAICSTPILLPIGIAFFAVFFSLFIVFLSLVLAFTVSSFALLVGAVFGAFQMYALGRDYSTIIMVVGGMVFASGLLLILGMASLQVGSSLLNVINRRFSKRVKRKSNGGIR